VSDQKDIEATKKELQEARHIRRIKIEYEALAAIIQTQPDRKSTQEKLSLLRQVLEASECECQKLKARLKQLRKQFHLLISTIQGLQQLFTDDEAS
jgi:THO complex subunit 7